MQNYEQIIDELKNRCKSRDNGTLFIKTEDNKSASIALERGVIVDCRFRHFKGMKAIELLRTVTSGKTSFSKDMVLGTVTDETLSTASVIELLSTTDTSTNKKVVEPRSDSVATNSQDMDSTLLKDMVAILSEYVGPMANVLSASHIDDEQRVLASKTSFSQTINAIASDIGNDQEGEEFKKRVMGLLDV